MVLISLTLCSSDDGALYGNHLAYPHPAMLKRYSSTFDEPFTETMNLSEQQPHQEHTNNDSDNPSIDRDNKLLSFSLPIYPYTLLDYAYRPVSLSISAQLHGMFFLAESPWALHENEPLPTELTCYRRNLFQITGTITLPRALRYILTDQGEQVPILGQELCISATESVEGNPAKIISVPWKTPAANATATDEKAEKEPPSMMLDLMNGQELDSEYASFPIAWKRLQFRAATANNGRRKELQQNFTIRLRVMATIATGAKVPVCEVHSGAIIVRGRSPRNFQSRKDLPLNGAGGPSNRKSGTLPAEPTRTSTNETPQSFHRNSHHRGSHTNNNTPDRVKISNDVPPPPFDYPHPGDPRMSPDFYDFKMPSPAIISPTSNPYAAFPMKSASYPFPTPSAAARPTSSPDITRPPKRALHSPPAPVALSLTDEPPSIPTKASSSHHDSPQQPNKKTPRLSGTPRPASITLNGVSSPGSGVDTLYEYFPLGLEDWMPPVDAVYRPHVVHHLNPPVDSKTTTGRSRSKRYFSEDQPP